ncbi:MAG: DUF4838 domain-containing protein [Clostridia bacterium]|nr:DUF4838 domain-containing protein [Clostridia bacterium]
MSELILVENSSPKMQIISCASQGLEAYAVQELVQHFKLVTGAEIPVVCEADACSCKVSLIAATPDTCPKIASLFAEDLAWIGTSDGFAVRTVENTIYIFGTNPGGVLNGVHDFIEKNLDVLWVRSTDIGLLYDPMPTVSLTCTDYREKSPFAVRGWHTCGTGVGGECHSDPATEVMLSRNKLNAKFAEFENLEQWDSYKTRGLEPFNLGHNVTQWLLRSPSYDAQCMEYWNTDDDGNPIVNVPIDGFKANLNYWSERTADTIADSIIAFLGEHDVRYIGVGLEDNWNTKTRPWDQLPFEYAPGQFVEPAAENYVSTVFFTCINRISRKVRRIYPDVTINTYAYFFSEVPPECELEDNICVVFAPLGEDVTEPTNTAKVCPNNKVYSNVETWKKKTSNLAFYNYYGCFRASEKYERPLADRIQADLQYYAENGFTGTIPEGMVDANNNVWAMNALTFWLYSKLAWNPWADTKALTGKFCRKAYGKAADAMLTYYNLVKKGWELGRDGATLVWHNPPEMYLHHFVFKHELAEPMQKALDEAWNAADETARARIRYIKETFEANIRSIVTLYARMAADTYGAFAPHMLHYYRLSRNAVPEDADAVLPDDTADFVPGFTDARGLAQKMEEKLDAAIAEAEGMKRFAMVTVKRPIEKILESDNSNRE